MTLPWERKDRRDHDRRQYDRRHIDNKEGEKKEESSIIDKEGSIAALIVGAIIFVIMLIVKFNNAFS